MGLYSETYSDMRFAQIDEFEELDFVDLKSKTQHDDPSSIEALTTQLATVLSNESSTHEEHQRAIQQIIHLFHETEMHVLKSLSYYLCELSGVPDKIIEFLAESEFSIAEPVLQKSPCLNEAMMIDLINMKDREYWQIMAQRQDLTGTVIEMLAKCRDILTSHNLLKNKDIHISDNIFEEFFALINNNHMIANLMAERSDLPKVMVLDIYWKISKALRSNLSSRYHISAKAIKNSFRKEIREFEDKSDTQNNRSDCQPTPLMWELALQYKKQSKITPSSLVKTLYDGRIRFFVAMFALNLNTSHDHIFMAMGKPGGRILTVMCKASQFKKEEFVSLFLKARASLPSNKPVDSEELHNAIHMFDRLSVAKAQNILSLSK